MAREIKIVVEYPDGKKKSMIVKSIDEAFHVCRSSGGVDWKPLTYKPWINRANL